MRPGCRLQLTSGLYEHQVQVRKEGEEPGNGTMEEDETIKQHVVVINAFTNIIVVAIISG